jgi:hypothetical protein
MDALKVFGAFLVFVIVGNILFGIIELLFFVLGGAIATGLFFGLMFFGIYKLAILWLNEETN